MDLILYVHVSVEMTNQIAIQLNPGTGLRDERERTEKGIDGIKNRSIIVKN